MCGVTFPDLIPSHSFLTAVSSKFTILCSQPAVRSLVSRQGQYRSSPTNKRSHTSPWRHGSCSQTTEFQYWHCHILARGAGDEWLLVDSGDRIST